MINGRPWLFWGNIVFILYLLLLCVLSNIPYTDLPNHLTRAYFIGEIIQNPHGVSSFIFDWRFQPYILGDLFLAGIVRIFPLHTAAMIWMFFLLGAFPLAVIFYFKERGENQDTVLLFFLLSPFLATNYFFVIGYANFCLGLAGAFVALGYWERFCRVSKNRIYSYICYFSFVCMVYCVHLAPILFLIAIVAVGTLLRFYYKKLTFLDSSLIAMPLLFLIAHHVIAQHLGSSPDDVWIFRPAEEKFLALGGMFVRFSYVTDILLTILFLLIPAILILKGGNGILKRALHQQDTLESILLFVAISTLFFILPKGLSSGGEVDMRAIPFMVVLALMLVCRIVPVEVLRNRLARLLCMLLALSNLVYLSWFLVPDNRRIGGYAAALSTVPSNQKVLGIATYPLRGRFQSNLHNVEIYMVDQGGFVPHVFSSNTSGDQLGYFSYKQYYYAPSVFWYVRQESVDWNKVKGVYDYLVVEKPVDRSRIGLNDLETTFENHDAVVYRIINRSLTEVNSTMSTAAKY